MGSDPDPYSYGQPAAARADTGSAWKQDPDFPSRLNIVGRVSKPNHSIALRPGRAITEL
jgi:hypothetical protein